jgi:hypothetical protein
MKVVTLRLLGVRAVRHHGSSCRSLGRESSASPRPDRFRQLTCGCRFPRGIGDALAAHAECP